MTQSSGSPRGSAMVLAASVALLSGVYGPAGAEENHRPNIGIVNTADRQSSPSASAPKANKPRDQRRQSDHRSAADSSSSRGSRGAGPDHNIYPGSKLPSYYHNYRIYVVDDWRAHHLSAPPRGHHWVQTGADYVLVAIVSGEVKQVLVVD
jgi:Ni/Co efflux regulator RcnB